jgi:ribosomal protein S18 acetylase RimI-like enzyme
VVSRDRPKPPTDLMDGMRPINLRTDLSPLADLIELVFADTMDSTGRAALREMRAMSRLGPGLPALARLNRMALGIHMGYVWMTDGRLIGNVSVYPANWPPDLGRAYIIANVGVHPDFQGRGIARQLMRASLDMIAQQPRAVALLQVDIDNHIARHLYRSLGFVEERAFTTWRRSTYARVPQAVGGDFYIARRRASEWKDEYALAERLRPQEMGGIGWLRPLHPRTFRRPPLRQINDYLNLRSLERLVVRTGVPGITASLWVETAFAMRTNLTLLIDPRYQGLYDDALLNTAVARYGRSTLSLEHPADDDFMPLLLDRYRFTRQRTVMHMRWDRANA